VALGRLVRAIADVDPTAIERAARQLGESRRILTPLAWAAGTLVLLVHGVKLLILNWRLSLIQLVPAARLARPHWRMVVTSGLLVGGALAFAVVVVPRFAGIWLFSLVLAVVLGVMMISFVAVPARIIGTKSQKLSPKEAIGRTAAGSTLSAVAMAPGFLLGRVGAILLGVEHFHVLGFAMLSLGTALYAAGMSSVKAVKLSMKLSPTVATEHRSRPPEQSAGTLARGLEAHQIR
jgi:hypothetical protein